MTGLSAGPAQVGPCPVGERAVQRERGLARRGMPRRDPQRGGQRVGQPEGRGRLHRHRRPGPDGHGGAANGMHLAAGHHHPGGPRPERTPDQEPVRGQPTDQDLDRLGAGPPRGQPDPDGAGRVGVARADPPAEPHAHGQVRHRLPRPRRDDPDREPGRLVHHGGGALDPDPVRTREPGRGAEHVLRQWEDRSLGAGLAHPPLRPAAPQSVAPAVQQGVEGDLDRRRLGG